MWKKHSQQIPPTDGLHEFSSKVTNNMLFEPAGPPTTSPFRSAALVPAYSWQLESQ